MIKVAVTDLEYNKALDIFEKANGFKCLCAPSPEDELTEFIENNDISNIIVGVNKYKNRLYEALPKGGVISRFGVGQDGINLELAKAKGIHCTNTPGVLDHSVAECAIGLILTTARHLMTCAADNKNRIWKNRVGFELSKKKLAVIGYGNIGRKVAKIAKLGFDMKIIGFDIRKPEDCNSLDEFHVDFATAVKDADFVTLHIPDIAATHNFINSERLAMMKNSAIVINTSRGAVLDENALYDAVKNDIIAGAGLDVFKTEPYAPESNDKDLRVLKRIIMTPHIGSSTVEACKRMAKAALENIKLLSNGKN